MFIEKDSEDHAHDIQESDGNNDSNFNSSRAFCLAFTCASCS